jgi:hypothetical protein
MTPQGLPTLVYRVPCLTVPFPANASLRRFTKTLLREADLAVGTGYSRAGIGPFHRDPEEFGFALNALGIQFNLGLLIVSNIYSRDAAHCSAPVLFQALSQFTASTGIPVLCIGTPGAAAALVEHGAVMGPLCKKGSFEIAPLGPEEAQWELWVEYIWDSRFRATYPHDMPAWFKDAIWRRTLGFTEWVSKLGDYVYSLRENSMVEPLTDELLEEHAGKALALEQPAMAAIRHVRQKGPTTRYGVRRFGDWLPLRVSMLAIPTVSQTESGANMIPLMGEVS